jgi:glycosyltransferase involved in cell wall biosynthesis
VAHPLYTHFGEPTPKSDALRRLGWKEGERVILFFGYIRAYKGLDLLLRAMPAIRARTGARLVVLGEFYEDRAPYDRLVERLSPGGSLLVLDPLDQIRFLPDSIVREGRIGRRDLKRSHLSRPERQRQLRRQGLGEPDLLGKLQAPGGDCVQSRTLGTLIDFIRTYRSVTGPL